MSESEKSRVFREYRNGDATRADVQEVFGDDFDEFERFDRLMDLVAATPTNTPSPELFD